MFSLLNPLPILPFVPVVPVVQSRTNKVNVNIGKKASGSALTDNNVKYLRSKIDVLNKVYNIIFKHLCHKKNVDKTWDILVHVKADLNSQLPNYLNDFCLGTPSSVITPTTIEITRLNLIKSDLTTGKEEDAINNASFYLNNIKITDKSYVKRPSEIKIETELAKFKFDVATNKVNTKDATYSVANKASAIAAIQAFIADVAANPFTPSPSKSCSNYMFDDAKLTTLINSMYVDSLLNKACLYRNYTATGEIANVQVGGVDFNQSFIDITQLLKENTSNSNQLSNQQQLSMICVQSNNQLKCKQLGNSAQQNTTQQNTSTNQSHDPCPHCNKWSQERNMFRGVAKDLLITQSMNDTLDLMNASVHLLPSAILNQNQYESFHSALDEYKKRPKMA